jgi:hypothetical protein
MCVWFFSLDAGTEEYGEEYDYYPEEDRAGFSSSDLTGEHFSLLPIFLLLPLYLTAILVCRSCHVSYRMSPIASLRPIHISYSCCLVTGSAMRVVGLLSTVVIYCYYYRYRHCYLVGLYLLGGSEIHAYDYICSISSHFLFMLIIKLLSRGNGGSAGFLFEHGSLVSTNILGS